MRKYVLMLICLFAFSGCGAGGGSAPPGSTVTIAPSSLSITANGGPLIIQTQIFTISLTDQNGQPLRDAKITMSFPYANPSQAAVAQFYDDQGNPVDSPFDAKTDDFGVYNLRVDFQVGGGLQYTGDLEVRSADAYGKATITVSP